MDERTHSSIEAMRQDNCPDDEKGKVWQDMLAQIPDGQGIGVNEDSARGRLTLTNVPRDQAARIAQQLTDIRSSAGFQVVEACAHNHVPRTGIERCNAGMRII